MYKKVEYIAGQYYRNMDHLNERLREQYGVDLNDGPSSQVRDSLFACELAWAFDCGFLTPERVQTQDVQALEQKLIRFYHNFGGSENKGSRSSCDVLAKAYVSKVAFRFTDITPPSRPRLP